jgi:hypothetical protein
VLPSDWWLDGFQTCLDMAVKLFQIPRFDIDPVNIIRPGSLVSVVK